jgi:hypothetical protein
MQRRAMVDGLAGDPILWTLTRWALLFSQRQTERSASRLPRFQNNAQGLRSVLSSLYGGHHMGRA